MASLYQPVKIGALALKNRIVMAPLTRMRAVEARTPNEVMLKYYVQRASAGLIVTEATSVTPQGVGYPSTPGIWSEEQAAGWRKITDAVHQADGKIVLQLWHVGRRWGYRSVRTSRRPRWTPTKFPASWKIFAARRKTRARRASTALRSTPPTAI